MRQQAIAATATGAMNANAEGISTTAGSSHAPEVLTGGPEAAQPRRGSLTSSAETSRTASRHPLPAVRRTCGADAAAALIQARDIAPATTRWRTGACHRGSDRTPGSPALESATGVWPWSGPYLQHEAVAA